MEETPPIASERLDLVSLGREFLHASLAGDLAAAERLLDAQIPAEWLDHRSLMALRLAQMEKDPSWQPWLLRAMRLRQDNIMVGYLGFHGPPGLEHLQEIAPGAVECGYQVFVPFRRQGYAREAYKRLMRWAHEERQVTRFILSIRPDNLPSVGMAQQLGFQRIGAHIDEIDGLEDIYELRLPAPKLAGEST
jgi:RimJ/RimL family protein N-acetyltransferase